MYKLIRPLLFCLAPESAHDLTLKALHFIPGFCFPKPKKAPVNVLGYDFDHPIGLAAGFDKNAEHLDACQSKVEMSGFQQSRNVRCTPKLS